MGFSANRNCDKNCVWGGQGSPQEPAEKLGLAKTPGSSMNRRADIQAASGYVSRGAFFWIASFAVLGALGLSSVTSHAESASAFYSRGQKAEIREDYDAAFDNFQKAYKKNPKDLRYRAAFYRVRITDSVSHLSQGNKLLDAGNEEAALAEYLHAAEIDPSNEAAQQAIDRVRKKQGEVVPTSETSLPEAEGKQEALDSMGAPPALKPVSNEPVTLHMQEDSKVVYQAVGKAAGVNILFDPDYTSKRIQVDLNNVSLLDALRIVGTVSNTFWRPVTDNTVFVAANTRAKRTELDEQAVQTFYLSNAWQQNDLTDVQTAIRNVLTNVKAYGVASQNAIVVRGTPDELLLVQKLINDLDKARPEVIVDISVLEVSKDWEKALGITWPTSASIQLQTDIDSTSSSSTSTVTATANEATLSNLAHLKSSNFLVTISAAKASLLLSDSNTKILDNPRIRCTDGQKATMKIGKKIPVATGSYSSGSSTSTVSSLVNTQFQYQDVGVNIEMTPTVHFDRDVTLKIKLEDSSEGASVTMGSGSDAISEPTIIQKTSEQVIRLREGEASIMSGMMSKTDTVSWNGVPGLSSIPGLKYLFGSKDHTITEDEIVFVLVPHIVRSQDVQQVNLRTVDTGVGTSVELRRVPTESASPNPAPKPASTPASVPARPKPRARSNIGTIPGQTAEAAAPAALAQMRAVAEQEMSENAATVTRQPAPAQTAGVSFTLGPQSGPVAAGTTFRVPVVLNGGTDIASVPLQIQYDPAKLSLVNVDSGDFLSRDGKPVGLVHRDDGPGTIVIGVSRPPGASGVSGTGVVCVLSFQAKTAGESAIVITHPGAVTSAQKQLPAQGARVSIQVR
jgi:general secretion pathway protein D